jgi:hypothetical protein
MASSTQGRANTFESIPNVVGVSLLMPASPPQKKPRISEQPDYPPSTPEEPYKRDDFQSRYNSLNSGRNCAKMEDRINSLRDSYLDESSVTILLQNLIILII